MLAACRRHQLAADAAAADQLPTTNIEPSIASVIHAMMSLRCHYACYMPLRFHTLRHAIQAF